MCIRDRTVTVPATQTVSITIVTTADVPFYTKAGTTIGYDFLVTNTGNVTLTGVSVTSNLVGLSPIVCPQSTLVPGQSMTCTATYATSQHDVTAGSVAIEAVSHGTSPAQAPVISLPSGVIVPVKHI